jgi:inner membrane protein
MKSARMPSPIGHALAGVVVGWMVDPPPEGDRHAATVRAALFGFAAVAPDFDFLVGAHRGPTHGIGSAAIAGALAWILLVRFRRPARRAALDAVRTASAIALAYASHTLLDWLGSDSTAPLGLMALWPFDRGYYQSNLQVFLAVSRRYWVPAEFWAGNLRALVRELAILLPLLAAVVWFRRGRPRTTDA